MLKNYWTETATSVKKAGLALRALVATVSGTGFIQGNIKMAFYVVLAGGILDFILQNLPPADKSQGPGAPPSAGASGIAAAGIALLLLFGLSGCTVLKPSVDHTKTDSTYTTYKQVDIKVTGAKVYAGLNMDSLFHAALAAKDLANTDSISRLNIELGYKKDSIAALKANKAIPPRPLPAVYVPVKQYVTDPQTKAQLAYWIDAYGKFQITCESKDQTINTLQAQVTKLTKETTTTTKVDPVTPVWAKVVMWMEGILLLIAIVIIAIKTIL